eukprot:c7484_g1_i1.p1 GENE.c7484_g1_i1~~c7484_g1_i1.p1  ORF type:complete len:627 (-),score=138.78 c7484_g1_i1:446-2326(-)
MLVRSCRVLGILLLTSYCSGWRNPYDASQCKRTETGVTRCPIVDGGMCTLRQPASLLSVDHIKAKCPDHKQGSMPAYHNPITCDNRKPDPELAQALANYMFQNCGHWCIYSETIPGEKAWIWDQRGCWQKSDHCLTVEGERDHAISAKQKFCVDVKTAHELLDSGKSAGALQMLDRLLALNVFETDQELADLYAHRALASARLGREDVARMDSDKAISLDDASPLVRFLRAKVRLALGKVDDATEDLLVAKDRLRAFSGATLPIDMKAITDVENSIKRANADLEQAMSAYNNDIFVVAKSYFERVRTIMPQSSRIRLFIAECDLATSSEQKAEEILSEMTGIIKRDSSNVHALMLRGKAYLLLGNLDAAINHFKEGLRLDPDNTRCKKEFKRIRKLQAVNTEAEEHALHNRAQEAMVAWQNLLALNPPSNLKKNVHMRMCQSCNKFKLYKQAETHCTSVIDMDNHNVDALVERGDARVALEDYDKAVRDFELAFNQQNGRTRNVETKLNNAKRLSKQSKTRDYYKILGVSRQATPKEIKTAYKTLALEYHPDKYKGDDKEFAEKKFQEIALANEVLSNPEKRAMVDRGEDPNEQQQGGGGGGFPGGGFPGGARFNMNGRTFHFRFG